MYASFKVTYHLSFKSSALNGQTLQGTAAVN